MKIRIKNETTADDTLCVTCRYGYIIQGHRLRDRIVRCSRLIRDNRVPFSVKSCSDYSDRRRASLSDMREIAWLLRTDGHRRPVGFVRPSDMTSDEQDSLPWGD